ncbi:MAG: rRNA maturation RNase YbeY [Firmicutes bacterium]|nr:rRNA maturation RNase YbeY [Bacillota bacterium]
MNITFSKKCGVPASIIKEMTKAAEAVLKKEGLTDDEFKRAEISVTFLKSDKIQKLNYEYRGKDKSTDVLSFPMYESMDEFPEEGELQLGDVVINKEQAQVQAEEYGHTFMREMVYLFVHSLLHLLGYDHEAKEDKKVMRKREEEIMEEIGIER